MTKKAGHRFGFVADDDIDIVLELVSKYQVLVSKYDTLDLVLVHVDLKCVLIITRD